MHPSARGRTWEPSGSLVRLALVSSIALLALPGTASAHSGSHIVALDERASVLPVGRALAGIRARVLDGDRRLRLRVDPPHDVVVSGYGGEPFLRFSARGVEVNGRSPTAWANRLAGPATRPGWTRLSSKPELVWHDHRLSPVLPAGVERAGWTVPLSVDGHALELRGELVRVARPPAWPWLTTTVGFLAAALAIVALGRERVVRRAVIVLAAIAALAALACVTAVAPADRASSGGSWAESSAAGTLALAVVVGFLRFPQARLELAASAGALAAFEGLGLVGVLTHGVVVSELPTDAARLAVTLALGAGTAATLLAGALLLRRRPEYAVSGP